MSGNKLVTDWWQHKFNSSIGELDRVLSIMVHISKLAKIEYDKRMTEIQSQGHTEIDEYYDTANIQTLKHHAEDMILAGRKILKDLGFEEPK